MGDSGRQAMDDGFAEALEPMDHGVLWLDENLVVRGHNQAYRKLLEIERAAAQIRQQGDSQFDPVVVEAFLDVIQERETVSLVQWAESMSVGNQHIDEQHMILIGTINQLASAESRNDRPVVAMIIDELVGYAAFHFHFEEQLMEDCGYPQLESHLTWPQRTRSHLIQSFLS